MTQFYLREVDGENATVVETYVNGALWRAGVVILRPGGSAITLLRSEPDQARFSFNSDTDVTATVSGAFIRVKKNAEMLLANRSRVVLGTLADHAVFWAQVSFLVEAVKQQDDLVEIGKAFARYTAEIEDVVYGSTDQITDEEWLDFSEVLEEVDLNETNVVDSFSVDDCVYEICAEEGKHGPFWRVRDTDVGSYIDDSRIWPTKFGRFRATYAGPVPAEFRDLKLAAMWLVLEYNRYPTE